MKYKDLKVTRTIFLLAFLSLPILVSAFNPSKMCFGGTGKTTPPPSMTLSYSSNPVFCAGDGNINPITTNYTGGGFFFAQSSPGLNLNINTNTGVITLSLSTPGAYTVTLYGTGGSGNAVTTLTINPVPNVLISGSSAVCAGGSVLLTASGGTGYVWYNGSTSNQISVTPVASMTVSVVATNNFGCQGFKDHVITFNTAPAVFFPAPTASVCAGSTIALIAYASPTANVTFTWNPGGASGATLVVAPFQPQIYTVYAGLNGCISNANQLVNVIPTTNAVTDFSYIYPLCTNSGNPLPILTSSFSTGGVFYSDDPNVTINPTTGLVDLTNIQPGDHLISYSVGLVGCRQPSINTVNLTINPGGTLTVSQTDVVLEEGQSLQLGATGGSAYNWEPIDYLTCNDCDNPVATPARSITYCVRDLSDGCIIHACTNVIVVCVNNGDFAVPNAFTPNGDGNNDRFCLSGWSYCTTNFKVMIFDRWGEKVYESEDPAFCWDGVYNGKPLNSGVYLFTMSVSKNRDPISTKKGNITLIR